MPVVVKGLNELRKALRDAAELSPRVVNAGLKVGATAGAARARELAPKGASHTGDGPTLSASLKPYSNTRGAGVKTNHPAAGVQNYATVYWRKGVNGAPSNMVHMVNVAGFGAEGDRFMYKALEDTGPEMADTVFEQLTEVFKLTGWFMG